MVLLLLLLCIACLPFIFLNVYAKRLRHSNKKRRAAVFRTLGVTDAHRKKLVGFFHPYCNAGGGGERVLWVAIAAMQRKEPDVVCVVYSGDIDASKEDIIKRVKSGFDITLHPETLHFVFLKNRYLVEDSQWPQFTLLGQSLGSMYLAYEAMTSLIPDLYIDTMGYAFTFHVVSWLGGIPVGAYVHYPTISTDMLARVKGRKQWHTNSDTVSRSAILSKGKLIYYRLFMYYYSLSLRTAVFIMVNSSWTKNHVDAILQHSDPLLDIAHCFTPLLLVKLFTSATRKHDGARIVYPSCDTREMAKLPLEGRKRIVLSIAQFRPEKDHAAQLHSFHCLLTAHPEYRSRGENGVKLVLLGGSRNAGDAARVENLRNLARKLDIDKEVEFVVNASYPTMLGWLAKASIGLSTMVDEHFGINIVEFMAAGVIPVTHASGGPFNDIVVPFKGEPTGFHATTPETFAATLYGILTLHSHEDLATRQRARLWAVQRFSEEEFVKGWYASGWKTWLPVAE